jgi:hypothetical protein
MMTILKYSVHSFWAVVALVLFSLPVAAQTGTTIDPQFANGVAHSELYPGSSLDERVNACILDAETGEHGATSHICSSEGESANNMIFGTINVGDTASDPVTWVLPSICNWEILSSSHFTGTEPGILQYSQTNIVGRGGKYSCQIQNNTGSKQLYTIYEAAPNSTYVRASGFSIVNKGAATALGPAMLITGGADTSYYQDIEVVQYVAGGTGIQIGGAGKPCCSASLNRITGYGNNTGGPLLSIVGNNAGAPNGVTIANSSFGHPAAGVPVISCIDNYSHGTTIAFINLYEEGTTADNTTPLNQVNGCRSIHVSGMEMKVEGGSATAPGWQLNGTNVTNFDIQGLAMTLGFVYPAIAVQNNQSPSCSRPPCNVLTDTHGDLAAYSSAEQWAGQINVFGGYEVDGEPLSFANLAGTLSVPSQLGLSTNTTFGAMRGDGTSITCVDGVCSSLTGGSGTLTGSGFPGSIPLWTNAINQTSSAISDNGNLISSKEPMSVTGNITATGTVSAAQISSPAIVGSALHQGSCVATYTGGLLGTADGFCQVASTESVSFSATPVFSNTVGSSRIVVSGNLSFTLAAAGGDGQHKCLNFVHDATSNAYKVTAPANVHGFFIIGSAPGKHNLQCFTYFNMDGAWEAESPGVINQ